MGGSDQLHELVINIIEVTLRGMRLWITIF